MAVLLGLQKFTQSYKYIEMLDEDEVFDIDRAFAKAIE